MHSENYRGGLCPDAEVTGFPQHQFYSAAYTRSDTTLYDNIRLLSKSTSSDNMQHVSAVVMSENDDTDPFIKSHTISESFTTKINKNTLAQSLVSCIMPTRNRRFFIKQSIKYFLNQDYENKELIIIDDGDDPVSDIIPCLPNIFYYRYNDRLTIGEKRNIGCEKANGDLIAHWDDDDWFSNQRLSIQIKYLLGSQSDICGFSDLYYYSPSHGFTWLYTYRGHDTWIAGGTFLYKRELWKKHYFASINQAEDSVFLNNIQKYKIFAIKNKNLYVGVMHTENSSAKYLDDPSWSKLPLSVVSNLFSNDRVFYVNLRRAIASGYSFTSGIDEHSKGYISNNKETRVSGYNHHIKLENSRPLVSCIMPTFNRVNFVKQSIYYFLRQTYSNKELIIIDDGDRPVADLIPDDPRIKYMRLSSKYSIGKKRNLACEIAEGEIIMCWDDDDWHGPMRIQQQIFPLVSESYDASGIGTYLYYSLMNKCFYNYKREVFKDGIVSGTLTFWKRMWEEGVKFKDMSLAEDADFQDSFRSIGARIKRILTENIFFIVRHDKNTWSVGNTNLNAIPVPEYIPKKDLEFYEEFSNKLNCNMLETI